MMERRHRQLKAAIRSNACSTLRNQRRYWTRTKWSYFRRTSLALRWFVRSPSTTSQRTRPRFFALRIRSFIDCKIISNCRQNCVHSARTGQLFTRVNFTYTSTSHAQTYIYPKNTHSLLYQEVQKPWWSDCKTEKKRSSEASIQLKHNRRPEDVDQTAAASLLWWRTKNSLCASSLRIASYIAQAQIGQFPCFNPGLRNAAHHAELEDWVGRKKQRQKRHSSAQKESIDWSNPNTRRTHILWLKVMLTKNSWKKEFKSKDILCCCNRREEDGGSKQKRQIPVNWCAKKEKNN